MTNRNRWDFWWDSSTHWRVRGRYSQQRSCLESLIQTLVRYYLAAPDQFIVQQELIEYSLPISIRSQPVIVSRLPSTVYVCGETIKDPVSPGELAQIRSDVRAVLSRRDRRH
jgi:hypothetical protein